MPLNLDAANRDANDDFVQYGGESVRAAIAGAKSPPAKLYRLLDPAAWEGVETPAREWAWKDYIPHRQATYFTGAGSAGKSLLAQQLCTAIALGRPFLGVETRQAVAIYVTCEDDDDELHRRQKAICKAFGVPLSALSGKLHLVSLAGESGNELATFTPEGKMSVGEAYRVLSDTAKATGAGFLALDNVAHLFAGNENIRNQVAGFVSLLNGLAHEIDGSVFFLGHPNKAGQDFSGSTAWENQVRSRLFMEVPKEEDGSIPDAEARVLLRGKANYARNGERLTFRWHEWALILPDDLPSDQRAELAETIQANAENSAFLRCLNERNEQQRQVSDKPNASNYAPRIFEKMTAQAKGVKRAAFERAMERLFTIGAIERGFLYRDTAEGRDVYGLREVSAEPSEKYPKTVSEQSRKPAENDRNLCAYSINTIPGAAHGSAAPYSDDDLDWGEQEEGE